MTAWIISIGADYPDHLDLALEDGFWDTKQWKSINPGDEVFFWQAAGSGVRSELKAQVVATSELERIEPGFRRARWRDRDEAGYTHRFTFNNAQEPPTQRTQWREVQSVMDRAARLWPITRLDSRDAVNLLTQRFPPRGSGIDVTLDRSRMAPDIADQDDRRRTALRSVAIRQGQGLFRADLMRAYGRRCAFTGTVSEGVLEAAHIFPYRGSQSNHVTNGILLRADVHTLFDGFQLAVDASYRIHVGPGVHDDHYRALDGTRMRLPSDPDSWPAEAALADHWRDCEFVRPGAFASDRSTRPVRR
ncbi:HNH endonuclease [Tsukamurella pseudospumae]|uniref:HNH nuclease domain-containing protein n=1 Tax=Tsukamurella pseudospumae TaxID=239498 RepID=A0A138AVP2_9ACTN|nr:HNH endonuclease [Tsukamurella pseudospumae]KXP14492.1 hypothetical protein AXK60_00850 [Tsukamurella pseudospumae]